MKDREFYSLEEPGSTERFRRLCFGLCFFHGVVVSRIQVWMEKDSQPATSLVWWICRTPAHTSSFVLFLLFYFLPYAPKYGPIGWNASTTYEFSYSDLSLSLTQLRDGLRQCTKEDELSEALLSTHYLIAECNYGGRIIDKYDRRLLKVFQGIFLSLLLFAQTNFLPRLYCSTSTMQMWPLRHATSSPSPAFILSPPTWPWRRCDSLRDCR